MFKIKIFSPKNAKSAQGQSLVEFALVLPILLLLFMGIIDFGRVLFTYAQSSSQMRQALRMAAVIGLDQPVYLDCTGMRNVARRVYFISGQSVTVEYLKADTWSDANQDFVTKLQCDATGDVEAWQLANGDILQLEVDNTIRMITPLFPETLTFTLSGRRTIVKEIALAGISLCGDAYCDGDAGETADTCEMDCATVTGERPVVEKIEPVDGSIINSSTSTRFYICATDGTTASDELTVKLAIGAGAPFEILSDYDASYEYETGKTGCWYKDFDTTNFGGKSIKLTAWVKDSDDDYSSLAFSEITVKGVVNDPPSDITISAPTNLEVITGSQSITISVTDDDDADDLKVYVRIGLSSWILASWTGDYDYAYTWDTTTGDPGDPDYPDDVYSIQAKVVDTISQSLETNALGGNVAVCVNNNGGCVISVSEITADVSGTSALWDVTFTFTVVDANGDPVNNAELTGEALENGTTSLGPFSCTTAGLGQCEIEFTSLDGATINSMVFNVSGVTNDLMVYVPDVTTITANKPL